MAQPTPYDRVFNFQNQQALTPAAPIPAQQLDAELNAIKITLDELLSNIALIQREDGALRNQSVGRETLNEDITLGFGAPEQQGPSDNERLTSAVDMYGLGRTILFCLCGQPDPPPEQRDLLPAGLASIVANCLSTEPRLRPSAAELIVQLASLPVPDGQPRFPSTHLTAGTSSSGDPGTQDSASPDNRSDTHIPKQPGTGL